MKKLALLLVILGILVVSAAVCHGDSGLELQYGKNTYSVEEAASPDNGFPFKVSTSEDTTVITDPATGIEAHIRVDSLDDGSFDMLRQYYNNYKASDTELFGKYEALRESYIDTLQDIYRMSFLYGNNGSPDSESNMKMFYEGTEKIFGQDAKIFLYNTSFSDKLKSSESTHLDMVIPVAADYTLISINTDISKGNLDAGTIKTLGSLLGTLRFGTLPSQTEAPAVLRDEKAVSEANEGIYPDSGSIPAESAELDDAGAGYSLTYPGSWIPYMQNSIGGRFDYKSFKIDPGEVFSVTAEFLTSVSGGKPDAASVQETAGGSSSPEAAALEKLQNLYKSSISITSEGKTHIGGSDFAYLKYSLSNNGTTTYYQDYIFQSNTALYTLRLESQYSKPSVMLTDTFEKVVASFRQTSAANTAASAANAAASTDIAANSGKAAGGSPIAPADKNKDSAGLLQYTNNDEGYGFNYPKTWQLKDISKSINYDDLKLVLPDLSGPLDVYISEGELLQGLDPDDIPACLAGIRSDETSKYIKKYTPPYQGMVSRLLGTDCEPTSDGFRIYRTVDYKDDNGRNRLAYSIDMVSGLKIYSMFVTVAEYKTTDGRINDPALDSHVRDILDSFHSFATKESTSRRASGETRSGKIVFAENNLRKIVDPALKLVSAEDFNTDGSFYVTVGNTAQGGVYKVRMDYTKKTFEVLDRTFKSTILKTELEQLEKLYAGSVITGTETNEDDMTIVLSTAYNSAMPPFKSTYQLKAQFVDGNFDWTTVRKDHPGELKKACEIFMNWIMQSDARTYFSSGNVFDNIDAFTQKNYPFYTAVYTAFRGVSGYFILKIEPQTDKISIVAYKSPDQIVSSISAMNGFSSKGLRVSEYKLDEQGFKVTLSVTPVSGGKSEQQTYRVWYNQETMSMDFGRI